MPRLIESPTRIEAAGEGSKIIEEYIGRVNSGTEALSIAKMSAPGAWREPGQRPEFDEYTIVLAGALHVEQESGETIIVGAGQAILCEAGEWVRYSTGEEGAEYVAVCMPGFSPQQVHRDE